MADLDRSLDLTGVYSNVDECEILPLFVRYSTQDTEYHDKNALVSFADTVAKLSGVHTCYFIHRRQKGKNKVYEEIAIKFDELPYCMTAQLARDESSLRSPHFSEKNMVLPEEKEQYEIRKCDVRFVDFNEDLFKLFNSVGPYWIAHVSDVSSFLKNAFSLPIPPIEIQIEEDKDMWQAYLEGLNAILVNKRDLIKIKSVGKQKGALRLDFDMDSYAQNLKEIIVDKLSGQCEQPFEVSIEDGSCQILFERYQSISDDTIDEITTIGKEYCFSPEGNPINSVSGKISIISNSDELATIIESIHKELEDFGVKLEQTDTGEFILSSDADIDYLKKIADTKYPGVAEVVTTTKIVMPLVPSPESIIIEEIIDKLPESALLKSHNRYFVVSSKKPLDTSCEIFTSLRFISCQISIAPQIIDTTIEIEGATIKGNAYQWIVNDSNDLKGLVNLFNEVRKKYTSQFVNSKYNYAFAPQINKEILQRLKLNNYGKTSLNIDVPRSCVIFSPKSKENFETSVDDILSQLGSDVIAERPKFIPKARVEFLSESIEYRRGIFEKVNIALTENRQIFAMNKLNRDVKDLLFEFRFDDIDERDGIEKIIEDSLSTIHGVRIIYDDDNNKGITQWSFSEDPSLLQELDRKLQSDFRNENLNYINGREYDRLSDIDDDEMNRSHLSKERIIRNKRYSYLKNQSQNLGTCLRRCRDYAIIDPTDEIADLLNSKEFKINAGDYIQFPAMGETMELSRQSKAMNRILKPDNKFNSRPINPNLPNFIFDPKYASETVVNIDEANEEIRSHKIGNLNEKQLEAVTKSVLANDIALIQGPPGTGKTTVIAEIILQAIRLNPDCRILLTSQTNLAVDNALERLQGQAGIRPVRIGKPDKLEPEGRRFSLPIIDSWAQDSKNSEDNATKIWIDRIAIKISNDPQYATAVEAWKSELREKDKHSRAEFCRLYKCNVNLVAATCSICGSRDFEETYSEMFGETKRQDMYFDIVIMDEASKATPLEMAVPLVLGKKIIIIGDHKQLPPMMDENTIDSALEKMGRKDLAEKFQKAESQFKRLFESASKVRKTVVSTLDTQYRMHEQIMNTIKQFYQEELAATGGLKCGIVDTMDIPDLENKGSRWHGITLNPIINTSTHAVWIDVKSPETALNPGFKNEGELKAIDLILRALEQADGYNELIDSQKKPEDKEIGIITFYSAQSREIKKKYKGKNYRMDVVDRFQGMERNIIIVSTVRSNAKNNIGFAKEIERINVAFSRARRLLIVVGNKQQFESNNNYSGSIANMETVSFEQLKDAVR
ncbi:MAG: AAA domain-containing protein [Parabacteroides sp.]|nr:AAA domain-containing protein [Parabacteroides sp.]